MHAADHGGITRILAAAGGTVVLIIVLIGAPTSALLGGGGNTDDATCVLTGSTAAPAVPGLDATQTANAEIIISVAAQMGLPAQAAVIAVATAMQESGLRNLDHGDQDSLGLFQQRPSQGWGTPAQIMNPVYAATAFYNALIKVPGWQQLPLTVAAQDVQHSGYPDAYAQWQNLAGQTVTDLTGSTCSQTSGETRGVIAAQWALTQLGKPYQWGSAGPNPTTALAWLWSPGSTPVSSWAAPPTSSGPKAPPSPRTSSSPAILSSSSPPRKAPAADGDYVNAPETGQDVRIDSLTEPWSIAEYVGGRTPE